MGGKYDRRETGTKKSSFLSLEVSPECYRQERIGETGGPGREGRQRGETKWITIKDRREEQRRETSKLLEENGSKVTQRTITYQKADSRLKLAGWQRYRET